MLKTRIVPGAVLGAMLVIGGAMAERPRQNIDAGRHPNLAAAQNLCAQAFAKIDAAQQANEWDLSGHAQKAKELLDQASRELKAAAEAANRK